MLQLHDITRSFGDTVAVDRVSLTFEPRRTTVLLGPSGCGKSTLLRLMMGLVLPDRGRVELDGVELSDSNVLELRHRLGYVIQDGGLFPHLVARDNVTLMARYLGWTAGRIQERVQELAALTRFPADGLDRYPAQLSGGQAQRVALMRALMLDPVLLLLDEPLGSLDPLIRADLQQDLREIFRTLEKTVVMVTHDLAEAGYFGDTIVVMRAGRVIQTGALQDLVTRPADAFVTRFINAQRSPLEGLEVGGA